MKKSTKILLIAAVYLGACYGIGQYRNSLKQEPVVLAGKESSAEQAAKTTETGIQDSALVEEGIWSDAVFEGVKETTDTPWNFNAGIFTMDDVGSCVLLTPNTSVSLNIPQDADSLSICYEIHPWMKEISDGAGMVIWIMDKNDNILSESTVSVNAGDERQVCKLDLSELKDAYSIKILCNNGNNNDDSGDWVVIREAQPSDM